MESTMTYKTSLKNLEDLIDRLLEQNKNLTDLVDAKCVEMGKLVQKNQDLGTKLVETRDNAEKKIKKLEELVKSLKAQIDDMEYDAKRDAEVIVALRTRYERTRDAFDNICEKYRELEKKACPCPYKKPEDTIF